MSDRPWLDSAYPEGVPADIDPSAVCVAGRPDGRELPASTPAAWPTASWARTSPYGQTDSLSRALAAYLQGLGLAKGDRVAIMMPNVPQYPVAVAAILRAGFVVVNVNPLYTPRELEHQLKDSGAKAIVIIENFANTLEQCIAATPVKHVVLCRHGRPAGPAQGGWSTTWCATSRRWCPPTTCRVPCASTTRWPRARAARSRSPTITADDVAVLQYTGGTTGVSKGAVLLHRNVIANVLQSEAWNEPGHEKGAGG
jgi:long-chain acyl-CoA synthetase